MIKSPWFDDNKSEKYAHDANGNIIDEDKMMKDFFQRHDNQSQAESIKKLLLKTEAPLSIAKALDVIFSDKNYNVDDCTMLISLLGGLDSKSQLAFTHLARALAPNDYNTKTICQLTTQLITQLSKNLAPIHSSSIEMLLSLIRKKEFPELLDSARIDDLIKGLVIIYMYQPHTRSDIYNILNKTLQESSNEALVFVVARYILANYQSMQILQEDELFQKALRVQLLLSESEQPKNPYKIHKNLLQKRTQEINFTKLTYLQFFRDQSKEDGKDYKIGLNPHFLKALSQREFDVNSVPDIHPMILDNMITEIHQRVLQYPNLSMAISNSTGTNFNEIRLKTLNGIRYLPTLLTAPKQNKSAAQLRCLLHHISTLDHKDGANDLLSTQEMAFLKLLNSIVNCPIGQDGGIAQAYLQLPYDARLKTKDDTCFDLVDFDDPSVIAPKAYELLCDLLQDCAEEMFSGTNQLMVELCGETEIKQAVHQGLYLKNLIGDLVGSRHNLKFDLAAQLYYEGLLALSRQEAAEVFYKHANEGLNHLVHYIQLKVNQTIGQKSDHVIYNEIVMLLSDDIKDSFELDDNNRPLITLEGVVKLLIKISALHQDTSLF